MGTLHRCSIGGFHIVVPSLLDYIEAMVRLLLTGEMNALTASDLFHIMFWAVVLFVVLIRVCLVPTHHGS